MLEQVNEGKSEHPYHKRFIRRKIEIRVEVERLTEAINTSTLNISIGGISFQASVPLEMNEPVRILLYIPRKKDVELIKIESKVMWCEARNERFEMGAQFMRFSPGDQKRMRTWLQEVAVESPNYGPPAIPGKK